MMDIRIVLLENERIQSEIIGIKKMKLFPIHIVVKDLSFMIFYFILMKYNLTNETYLPEMISNFPGAPKMTLWDMLCASLIFNIFPLVLSFATYYPIVYLVNKMFKTKNTLSLLLTGLFLTLTTPIMYLALHGWKHNDYYMKKAEIIAWALCFVSSVTTYYLLNKSKLKSNVHIPDSE